MASASAGLAAGALAGFALGVLVAQRVGGIAGIAARLRQRVHSLEERFAPEEEDYYESDEFDYDEDEEEIDTVLENRVLEAFRNDPVLSERAVDIGAIGDGIIELSGWVETEEEAEHAVTLARGVPGVGTVVNRLAIGEEEELYQENAERVRRGDPALTESRWEGIRVGTGRRRQGTSDEPDRHADPKPRLESRWLDEQHAIEAAAEDLEALTNHKRKQGRDQLPKERGTGSPVAPTGVPKGDHVADHPESAGDEHGRQTRE